MSEYIRYRPPRWRRTINWILSRRTLRHINLYRSWQVTIHHDEGKYWLDSHRLDHDDQPGGSTTLDSALELCDDLSAWNLWGKAHVYIDRVAAIVAAGDRRREGP